MAKDTSICPKRRISRISEGANQVPLQSHEQVRMGGKRGYCVACKGLQFGDRPQKRFPYDLFRLQAVRCFFNVRIIVVLRFFMGISKNIGVLVRESDTVIS